MINNTFSGSLRRLKTWWALRRSRRESSREGNKCSWRAPGWELSDFSSKTAFASLRTPFVAHGGSLYTLWQMWRESSRWGQRNPESGWKWGSPCWRLKNASRVNIWKIHFNTIVALVFVIGFATTLQSMTVSARVLSLPWDWSRPSEWYCKAKPIYSKGNLTWNWGSGLNQ